MELRDYQEESVGSAFHCFDEGLTKVLLVVPGGGGKTAIMSEMARRTRGNCLILADARKLVEQAADEHRFFASEDVGVEMGAEYNANPDGPLPQRVIVASTQTMFNRLHKYPRDHFDLIMADECHKNALGDMAQSVLTKFHDHAKVVGLTATPFRADKKDLSDYFQKVAYEIGLDRLIRDGSLVRIKIKSVPLEVDLRGVKTQAGDFSRRDVGEALEPLLQAAADCLIEHAEGRKKIVVFLPLCKTSSRFAEILNGRGVKAVHVDGEDDSKLSEFTSGDARVVCNACLLTTGWNYPPADCIFMLRATKSLALFQQCALRGTRLSPDTGKRDMLLLDPLYITDDHKLITPASIMAKSKDEVDAMMEKVRAEECADGHDLLDLERDAEAMVAKKLEERVKANRRKKMRLVDVLEFTTGVGEISAARYQPEFEWEKKPPSEKQITALEKAGIDTSEITTQGKASKVLDILFTRRKRGLATPKQVRLLNRMGHPSPDKATFKEASDYLDRRFSKRPVPQFPPPLLIALRRAGLSPYSFKSVDEAEGALAAKINTQTQKTLK